MTNDEYKTALTSKERIKCAYLHLLRGVPQQDLATAFEVNIGRVNEAITAIEKAAAHPLPVALVKENSP